MSTSARSASSAPAVVGTDVLQRKHHTGRIFVLNRPAALNALTTDMVRSITPQLEAWNKSDLANVIILKSAVDKAFCAGGDVKTAVDLGRKGDPAALQFFEEEYQMNHLLATSKKPIVAMIHGITMGGGVGLSVHTPFRVATETTTFAMPETAIGLFPDVGGSFFLPRLDGETGTYLALTGHRLKGRDVFYAGVASHYVPSERLPALEERLCELPSSDPEVVNAAIEDYVAEPPLDGSSGIEGWTYSLEQNRAAIDRCFKYNTIEEIIAALEQEKSAWADKTLETIRKMSPTSLKVSLMMLRQGRELGIAECLQMEFQLVQKFVGHNDFHEGVTSLLVKRGKEAPKWNPSTIEELDNNTVIRDFFRTPTAHRLNLLNNGATYTQYPHAKFALPSEDVIRSVVSGESGDMGMMALNTEETVDYFLRKYNNKVGVEEKVRAVLGRKANVIDKVSGALQWKN
ncbi:ClpP/crotonase [Ramicandelaber brevisporus]|nr:ClpP/crotonase [Ramicandelaber brevisporus]